MKNIKQIILPDLGENINKVTIVQWHVKEGDKVKTNQDILEIVTDKAAFDVPSNLNGVIKKIIAKPGQEVNVNAVLAILE